MPKKGGRRYDYYRIRTAIGNTNLEVLQRIQQVWGGAISANRPRPKHKRSYTWRSDARQVIPFLKAISPFLMIKTTVVQKALELQSLYVMGGRHRIITIEEEQRRFGIYQTIRTLNKRGVGSDIELPLPKEFVPIVAERRKTIDPVMVAQIRRRYITGEAISKIAGDLNISVDSVRQIGQGKSHVSHPEDRKSLQLLEGKERPKLSKQKTHCSRGHKFTESNTGIAANGWRWCRKCSHLRYLATKNRKFR